MRAFICLISSNALAKEIVEKEQANLVPQQLRRDPCFTAKGSTISVGIYDPNTNRDSLTNFVFERSKGMDLAALLIESDLNVALDDVAPAILVGTVVLKYPTLRMSIEAAVNRTLRNLLHIHSFTKDEKMLEVLLLPKKNFIAEDLNDLLFLGKTAGSSDNFIAEVSGKLALLRKRRRPRRRAAVDPKKKYIVDNEQKLFDYGYEDHSKYETGAPHTKSCILAARYRLGAKIPLEYRHYNMTKEKGRETWITGEFPDCHHTPKSVNQSHVNIFANDYH
jgi:hypothetical protein